MGTYLLTPVRHINSENDNNSRLGSGQDEVTVTGYSYMSTISIWEQKTTEGLTKRKVAKA